MKHTCLIRLMSVAVLMAPVASRASNLDALIVDLAGQDEVARTRARRLLPREDVMAAAPQVVALVRQDQDVVWRAAFNVLMDFTGAVSVPGREAERAELAKQVMALVAPEQPQAIKIRGLRLLPLVVPAGCDVGPMAALLDDKEPVLQEKARAALQETGTPEAVAALRAYLPKAQPAFQCAILNSLGALKDAGSLKAIEELTRSPDAKVRAAAVRAMAWTGDPFRFTAAKRVLNEADDATRQEAADAMIRLVNAIEEKGGNWETAVGIYRDLLGSPDPIVKQAGLAGLGRIGDGTCVRKILFRIREAPAPVWQVGVAALRQMQGVDAARVLVAEYPAQPAKLQPALLEALGSKKHPIVLPILTEAAKSNDPQFRLAALSALGETGLVEALPVLADTAAKGEPPEMASARAAMLKIGDSLRAEGKNKPAGQAYLAALKSGRTEEERRPAVEGLVACPVPEAFDSVRGLAESKESPSLTARALVAIGGSLTAAKRNKEGIAAYEAARNLDGSPELMKLIAVGLRDAGAAGEYAAVLGLLTNWWVVGPFDLGEDNAGWEKAYVGEPDVTLTARYMAGKRRVEWQPAKPADDRDVIDLHKALGAGDNLIAYAYTEVTVEQDTNAVLLVGADDSERIWVNGQKVFDLFAPRGLTPDQDKVRIKLKAGKNVVLMKIWQRLKDWQFCARLTTPDGRPLTFTQKAK